MCTSILRCPITPLTIESTQFSSLFYFLSCFWLLPGSSRHVERRPNSKLTYVHFLSMQNQPASNAGSWCFSLPCPDPWPPLNPDLLRATWQAMQTSGLSWQTQTRFSQGDYRWSRGSFKQKCTKQIWISGWFLQAPDFLQLLSLFSVDKMRESATADQRGMQQRSDTPQQIHY